MAIKGIKTSGSTQSPFSGRKSYSIADIMTSGGTTAFANKLGKNPANIQSQLNKLPDDAFLTNDEANKALETLMGVNGPASGYQYPDLPGQRP